RTQRRAHRAERRVPDLFSAVLDPAGAGEMLRQLGVAAGLDAAPAIEREHGGAGGALIDGQDMLRATLHENLRRGEPTAASTTSRSRSRASITLWAPPARDAPSQARRV